MHIKPDPDGLAALHEFYIVLLIAAKMQGADCAFTEIPAAGMHRFRNPYRPYGFATLRELDTAYELIKEELPMG